MRYRFDICLLSLAPSKQAELRAFVRIVSDAPLVRDRIEGSASVMKHTQHVLSTIVSEAEARRVVGLINAMDNPRLPRHMELYYSNCGDATTLAMLSDAAHGCSDHAVEPFIYGGHHTKTPPLYPSSITE